jgi:hypothetical protein
MGQMPDKAWRAVIIMMAGNTLSIALATGSLVLQVGYQPAMDVIRNARTCKAPPAGQQLSMILPSEQIDHYA